MHGVVRNIGVHQVVIAFMVFVFPGYVMAADQETIIKELGPYMELYQGSWDNREPPPEGQGKWIPLKTQNYATSETDATPTKAGMVACTSATGINRGCGAGQIGIYGGQLY